MTATPSEICLVPGCTHTCDGSAAEERDRLREALQEIAADHDPEPPEGPYNRAWCHCGNWSPTSCTAAIAQAALSEKEP